MELPHTFITFVVSLPFCELLHLLQFCMNGKRKNTAWLCHFHLSNNNWCIKKWKNDDANSPFYLHSSFTQSAQVHHTQKAHKEFSFIVHFRHKLEFPKKPLSFRTYFTIESQRISSVSIRPANGAAYLPALIQIARIRLRIDLSTVIHLPGLTVYTQ